MSEFVRVNYIMFVSHEVLKLAADPKSSQPDKFRDLARELECDEDEAAFEDKVRRVATTPKPNEDAAD